VDNGRRVVGQRRGKPTGGGKPRPYGDKGPFEIDTIKAVQLKPLDGQ